MVVGVAGDIDCLQRDAVWAQWNKEGNLVKSKKKEGLAMVNDDGREKNRIRKEKGKLLIVLFVALMIFTVGCVRQPAQSVVSKALKISVSGGNVLEDTDTHGGFHGDGETRIVLQFSNDKVLEQIRGSKDWKAFPVEETVAILAYGVTEKTESTIISRGPYITKEGGMPWIPEIQNGYYRLIDRHEENGKTNLLERNSLNFILAIYDADTGKLYYCEFDT